MASSRSLLLKTGVETLEARRMLAAATVNAANTFQTMEGMGAASVAWYFPDSYGQSSFYDLIVNDLGASGVRGAVTPNFEKANDNDDPDVFDWDNFDSEALGQVLQFKQRLDERGAEHFFLSLWTPPYWMKTNLSVNGGGSLRADMRAEFAEYCAAVVIAAKRDFGVEIDAISIQNEQFFIEEYESALYDAVGMRETYLAVQRKFEREGLSTKIVANEDLYIAVHGERWKWFNDALLEDPEVDRDRLVLAVHHTDTARMTDQANQLAGTGVSLWYTEISGEPATWTGALRTTRTISDAFTKANATAWYYWLYDYFTWGETASIFSDGVPNAKYHGLKHYYRYIRPGMERVETNIDESNGALLSAFKDPKTGRMTIVLMNQSNEPLNLDLSLSGLSGGLPAFRGFQSTDSSYWQSAGMFSAANGQLSLSMPANSLLTLTNRDELVPIPGNASTPAPISNFVDAVISNPLRNAAMLGRINDVNNMISAGWDVNVADPITGWTPLHAAAASLFPNAEQVVSALIAAGANVNAVTTEGFTPLHATAMNQVPRWDANYMGKSVIINQLVDAGAQVDVRDNAGRTPLMWSAQTFGVTAPNAFHPFTPFALLQRGANKLLTDDSGRTAYDYGMQEHRQSIVDAFLTAPGVDTQSPEVRFVRYDRNANIVNLKISENVAASLDASDIQVINVATNQPVGGWTFTDTFSNGQTIASLRFTARLPDGRYRVVMQAGAVVDQSGVASTQALSYEFTSLLGDATGDGRVNFDDLLVLAQNYGTSGRSFAQGDFNDDGVVNFDDLLMLAQRYGTSLVVELPKPKQKAAARR